MPKKEVWKQIQDFPNYEVSNKGRVRRNKKVTEYECQDKIIMNGFLVGGGYKTVYILNKNKERKMKSIHCLVLETFHSKRPEGKHCNHKDGNKLNNNLKNLEWVTPKENIEHAMKNGLMKTHGYAYIKYPKRYRYDWEK